MFYNNSAIYGSCLHLTNILNKDSLIDGCVFDFNNATEIGGVIYAKNSDFKIRNSNFSHNMALLGGVIFYDI